MELPVGVLAIYGALGLWSGLLAYSIRRKAFGAFLGFGILLLLYLNLRYFLEGAPAGIAFFIGIYDFLNNFGLSEGETAGGMASCVDNACTVWGDRFSQHSSWGVAFYDRFANGPQRRTNLLYGHIAFNSIAFVLMHLQLLRPGTGERASRHKLIGRATFGAITFGTICAMLLAAEHGPVTEYGGIMSTLGFASMSLCVYGCAVMAVVAIRRGDVAGHNRWNIRFVGSMWGAFWIFRVMLFVLDPLLRSWEAVALQLCIWLSAPLGIALAEFVRRRPARSEGFVASSGNRTQSVVA